MSSKARPSTPTTIRRSSASTCASGCSQGGASPEALGDSIADLDGAYNYLVVSSEGLGIVRDRFGFKPLMLAETDRFVAVATEEIALRRAIPGDYAPFEPPPGSATLLPAGRSRGTVPGLRASIVAMIH